LVLTATGAQPSIGISGTPAVCELFFILSSIDMRGNNRIGAANGILKRLILLGN